MRHPLDIVKQIRETQGTNAKLDILRNLESGDENSWFMYFAKMTYDAKIRFWVRNVEITPMPVEEWKLDDLSAVNSLLASLASRNVTGNDAIQLIQQTVAIVDRRTAELIKLVLLRDFDCGLSVTSFNKIWPGLIPTYELMACHTLVEKTAKKIEGNLLYVQMKYDAARVSVEVDKEGKASFYTRNGNPYFFDEDCDIVKAFSKPEFAGLMFDGEMISHKGGVMLPRKTSNGIGNKLVRGTASREEMDSMIIRLWDVYSQESFDAGEDPTPYYQRFNRINQFDAQDLFDYCALPAENTIVETLEEAQVIGKKYIAQGYEGAIVKSANGPWEKDRVWWCLKIKAIREADLEVVGFNAGDPNSKLAGMVGSVMFASSDRSVTVNVSGISDELRAHITTNPEEYLGKIGTVLYNELIQNKNNKDQYSLFLPRLQEFRFDKTEADDLQKIKNGT